MFGFKQDLKEILSDAQSVWKEEKPVEDLYVKYGSSAVDFLNGSEPVSESVSEPVSESFSSNVVIGGFDVGSEVTEFMSVDKSDVGQVNAYIEKKRTEGWTDYVPTLGEQIIDTIADVGESVINSYASSLEKKFGVDIPYLGGEFVSSAQDSERSFNLLGLVIPASVLGLIFLL